MGIFIKYLDAELIESVAKVNFEGETPFFGGLVEKGFSKGETTDF
jgi:hypothetical protein